MNTETEKNNVIKSKKFKSEGDWINQVLDKHCSSVTGAQEEVKDGEGKVTQRAKKGVRTIDIEALKVLASTNHLETKVYPNSGMYRMNIGNMLRAAARKRGGLYIDGDWADAPEDFKVESPLVEDREGKKIVKVKPAVFVEAAGATA